jgi:hypothetical protein
MARDDAAGFTLVEMLIACSVMLTIFAATFALVHPTEGIFKAQPEVSDMQQRLRTSVDILTKDLLTAGAGADVGSDTGPLFSYLPPVLPYRAGDRDSDPPGTYRADAISVAYVPVAAAQATIRGRVPIDANDVEGLAPPNCPPSTSNQWCGFRPGMRVLLFDAAGRWDTATLTDVQPAAGHLQLESGVATPLAAGAHITQVVTHTYYSKASAATDTPQLMHYDGERSDLPVVDHIVRLEFQYFGDPRPPALLAGTSPADPVGPFTTYGPKPPEVGADDPDDTWPAGENCVFAVQDGKQVSRLGVLAAGTGPVLLAPGILTDGPWCPDGSNRNRFDADLLRIRRIGVRLRVQVGMASLRGPAGVLFVHGGLATSPHRYVPDQEIRFDITPRNLNLGR